MKAVGNEKKDQVREHAMTPSIPLLSTKRLSRQQPSIVPQLDARKVVLKHPSPVQILEQPSIATIPGKYYLQDILLLLAGVCAGILDGLPSRSRTSIP